MEFRVLELFSGIGGMHRAFNYAALPGPGEVVAAIDINVSANSVYSHNFPDTPCLNRNIQSLSVKSIEKLKANVLLMSPPCQPHTRVGCRRDVEDNRSVALSHICSLLPEAKCLEYVLLENVKGFESSQARNDFIDALEKSEYFWREFILSPTQFGVPNTRHRYYCLARKSANFPFEDGKIWSELPENVGISKERSEIPLSDVLESDDDIPSDMFLPEKVLDKRVWLLDIKHKDSRNTMCFTKAYTHYSEGTGSVFTPLSATETENIFKQIKHLEEQPQSTETLEKRLKLLKHLRLRYFTPREVARLMSFPEIFGFPVETTNKQRYRLLGNSINVKVVGELIKLLCS